MLRRSLFLALVASVSIFVGVGQANAQAGAPVRGVVKVTKADNTIVPVADATIEVFRTDSAKGSLPPSKTNKKGEFHFVQFPFGQTFALLVTGPGIAPLIFPAVKAGQENIVIDVKEGDGRKYTEAEVRQALAGAVSAPSGELTAEQKKAQAEQAAKVAAVEASNKKIEQENAIITRTLQEGNAAFTAKDFDLAIAKYSEGVAASPDFAGSAPVLLNNKGAALRERAVVKYNQSIKATDASVKVEGLKAVRADLGEAAESYNRSLTLLKNAKPTDITDPKIKESQITLALTGAKDTFRLMAATEQVDETKMEVAKAILPEYLAAEADPAKKEASKLILADLYRVVGDSANAIAEYRKVLEASPDNLDAMAGLGLSLVNAGYISNDKTQLQEGSNILQKYATSAPDGHKYKNDAVALVENLKAEQKITPQKVSAPKRKN